MAQSYSGYCCSFTLLGGIGYGIYSGVSYAYRAIVGTTEATEAVIDSENKQDANTVSVEQKGLDKPLYIWLSALMTIILVKVIVYSYYL